jgi:putative PIN family toxin of toxin-antitoxin system
MKIMLDSNIVIAAVMFDTEALIKLIKLASEKHELYISNNIINEVQKVILKKKPEKFDKINKLLNSMEFNIRFCPSEPIENIEIRDPKDKIILSDAIRLEIDLFITGDKDFFERKYEVEIIDPYDFLKKYNK